MTEPVTYMGVKVGTMAAMTAGSVVAGLLMQGQPLHVRIIAGACGCAAAFILTPIISPIAFAGWTKIFVWLGVPIGELTRSSVDGFVGFVGGMTGIDICRWMIDRTKTGLSAIKFPWPFKRKGSRGD